MEELLDPPPADSVLTFDPFVDAAPDAPTLDVAPTGDAGGTDAVSVAMAMDDGAMTMNLDDDSGHPEHALSDWLNGFIAERNSHPRIPGEYVIITDDGVAGWTDSMFGLADIITVTANNMIDAYVLHQYMDAINYAEAILMLIQQLEAMAMQDLGLQLVETAVRPQSAHPPPIDEIRAKGQEMQGGSMLALNWIYENDNLSGVTGMFDWNMDGDIDWNDASNIYNAWGMTFQANAAREAGLAFNDYQLDDLGNDPTRGEYVP